ncbi:hypothetical protein [Niabella drilacis]|uniref:Uncharacterized protein n=1 Tax=Niabella drilacis (strain DSM 25811 / CCM 8410 / CCUG 62505 / LMG 26954 / E90) TaxID=1285928 RepID=A0A1G6PN65_NIADE|nr:hypothetical protein [Niabella drilacis]SDC80775.1 hypothetical protein SAMN04487894_10475 [Niabella drilacis]
MYKTISMKPVILLLAIACLISCDRKSPVSDDGYNKEGLIVSEKKYQAVTTNNYTISNATIEGDSLFISFSASGCSGISWETAVVDAGRIAESNPVQRYIKLSLSNKELCAAVFSKKAGANIRSLRMPGSNTISFNLAGWNQPLLYHY